MSNDVFSRLVGFAIVAGALYALVKNLDTVQEETGGASVLFLPVSRLGGTIQDPIAGDPLANEDPSFIPSSGYISNLNDNGSPVTVSLGTALDTVYQTWGARHGVDWRLLKAIAIVESGENPNAKNPSDPSYGLMQVLCKNDGSLNGRCTNVLNVQDWDQATPEHLYSPNFNVHIAAQIIKWNIGAYGFKRGIAVYNRWASRNDPVDGPFGNQDYVNAVLANYYSLGGTQGIGSGGIAGV